MSNTLLYVILGLNIFIIFGMILFFINSPSKKRYVTSFFRPIKFSPRRKIQIETYLNGFAQAVRRLSDAKIGAIFVFEKDVDLSEYVNSGVELNSKFSGELMLAIFNKKSPLHDGGVIIKNWLVESCSSYFPTTKEILPTKYGARHRAAVGITEVSDSFAVVISEESGKISFVKKGKIERISANQLIERVRKETE